MTTPRENRTMALAMNGDKDAFAVIVTSYGPRLTSFAFRMLGNRDTALDIVQDAALRKQIGKTVQ